MGQLILQLALGSALMAVATGLQTLGIAMAMAARPHMVRRIGQPRVWPFTVLVTAIALWLLFGQTLGVWVWTAALLAIGAFDALEPALYYALSSYTTLGFGDELPDEEWRILGAMAGANGMLAFGLAASALVALVSQIRQELGAGE